MRQGRLKDCFDAVAAKRLSAVEVNPEKSNQHEFNGAGGFKALLGLEKQKFQTTFLYICDDEEKYLRAEGFLTWYNAREKHSTRSEHHLYYTSNEVIDIAKEGDLLIACKKNEKFILIIAENHSTIANQLCWLFNIEDVDGFPVKEINNTSDRALDYTTSIIIEKLGLNVDSLMSDEDYLEGLKQKFPHCFPATRIFSEYARQSLGSIEGKTPDQIILGWMNHEEMLFRTYERHIVQERLKNSFSDDVDEFIKFSLSIQNRRKSRAGYAFENHLEELFKINNIQYKRGPTTENKAKPDFLFPGAEEYHNPQFSVELLTMLGVKTTCKDRWRQVLAEADRIPKKHLTTLEPGISENQTDEMKDKNLQLVVPYEIHSTYTNCQQSEIMSINDFVELVKEKQDSNV